jgi:hypothetical protein
MADLKISQLDAITTLTPATDVLPVVNVGGVTKKITTNQILGSGGTATLASATITGAATVGTTLGVTGASTLASAAITGDLTVDTSTLKVDSTNNRVGINYATPAVALHLGTTSATNKFCINTAVTGSGDIQMRRGSFIGFSNAVDNANSEYLFANGGALEFGINATTAMTLNSTGLGVGVTPSAWGGSNRSVIQFPGGNSIQGSGSLGLASFNNAFNDGTNDIYIANGVAYKHIIGTGFQWFTAPAGTAGNAISGANAFVQAMTLDASGNLLVGKTASSLTTVGFQSAATGETSTAMAASVNGTTQWTTYSTGAAAFRFYVGMGGTVFATNTVISAISDSRLKENVQDIDVGLSAILALKPRKFDWKAGKGKDIKGDRGFIAQEFETVFPNLIDEWKDPAPEGEVAYKSVRQDLIPVLVKAIQELTARVQTLEAR